MAKNRLLSSVLMIAVSIGTLLVGCGTDQTTTSGNATPNTATESAEKPKTDEKPAQVVEMNLGHVLTPDSERHIVAQKMAELVEKKSNGTVKISLFPQSQLGGEVKQIQAVRTGTQAMLITSQAALENTINEYKIFDLPYLFDSQEQADKVLKGEVGDKFLTMLEQHGMVGLGWTYPNERNVFSSKPIRNAEDMKGLKIRVMQAPGYVKAYEALGSQPTPIAYPEVYLSLQQGVVDGGDTSPDQFVMDKFMEVAKYYNKTHVHYLPVVLAISKVKWDALTPDQQKALQESADEAIAFGVEYNKDYYNKYYEEMKKAGVEVVESDVEEFKEATEKVHNGLLSEIPNGKELFDEIQKAKES